VSASALRQWPVAVMGIVIVRLPLWLLLRLTTAVRN